MFEIFCGLSEIAQQILQIFYLFSLKLPQESLRAYISLRIKLHGNRNTSDESR